MMFSIKNFNILRIKIQYFRILSFIFIPGPSKPSNLRLTKASAGEATLQWDPPANKNGNLLKYVLDYFSESDGRVLEQELDVNVHEMQVGV